MLINVLTSTLRTISDFSKTRIGPSWLNWSSYVVPMTWKSHRWSVWRSELQLQKRISQWLRSKTKEQWWVQIIHSQSEEWPLSRQHQVRSNTRQLGDMLKVIPWIFCSIGKSSSRSEEEVLGQVQVAGTQFEEAEGVKIVMVASVSPIKSHLTSSCRIRSRVHKLREVEPA